jgi:hypothetical protein
MARQEANPPSSLAFLHPQLIARLGRYLICPSFKNLHIWSFSNSLVYGFSYGTNNTHNGLQAVYVSNVCRS